jgi:hypothetical protein
MSDPNQGDQACENSEHEATLPNISNAEPCREMARKTERNGAVAEVFAQARFEGCHRDHLRQTLNREPNTDRPAPTLVVPDVICQEDFPNKTT